MTTLASTPAHTENRASTQRRPGTRTGERAALLTAGLAWAGYLTLRPYGDETTLAGAEGIASTRWEVAHLLGMLGFVAVAVAFALGATRAPRRTSTLVAVLAGAGAVAVLPYYGAETFGLGAIAAEAVARQDVGLLAQLDAVRYGALALTTFGIGLLAVIAAGALHAWSGIRARAAANVALGAVVATMPLQFFLPAPLRVAHGLVVLAVAAWAALRRG